MGKTKKKKVNFMWFKCYCFRSRPLRALFANYTKQANKGVGRTKWMNSPNVYQKVEVLETGTDDPKKITKVQVIKFEDGKKK